MDIPAGAAVLRALSEYGILGLGWILFFYAMVLVKIERNRYQDLILHIITYFTKTKLMEGSSHDSIPLPPVLIGKESDIGSEREAGRDSGSKENGAPGGFSFRRNPFGKRRS